MPDYVINEAFAKPIAVVQWDGTDITIGEVLKVGAFFGPMVNSFGQPCFRGVDERPLVMEPLDWLVVSAPDKWGGIPVVLSDYAFTQMYGAEFKLAWRTPPQRKPEDGD